MDHIAVPGSSSPLFNPTARGKESDESKKARVASGKSKKPGEQKKSFISFIKTTVSGNIKELPNSEESLNQLLDEIHDAGDALSKRPFLSEISTYRTAVRNFINYVVENSFDTEEFSSGVNVLKRKKFTIVRVIDTKLEGMAAAILRGQLNQLEILEKLDEIKGLLVDLMQ